ncbi:hypothetical protein ID851_19065 [Xenorhabdus sp. 5]|nr:hypothetical protein [Xenorhabdus sp. 38]MBD2794219.1 hypothetical protein [Xenorhabdus sp. CUL]MBD2805184.1 hypothetical protein [Xenorhabdus sp. ZM]MBD2826978.1 hypothetical protein [Xenorhabdus sp. 5]
MQHFNMRVLVVNPVSQLLNFGYLVVVDTQLFHILSAVITSHIHSNA